MGICVASYVHGIPSWDGVGLETVRFPPYDRGLEPSNHPDLLISLSIRQIDTSPTKIVFKKSKSTACLPANPAKKKSKSTRDKSKMPTNQAKKSKSTTPFACKSSKKKSKSTRDKSKMPTNQAKKSKSTTPIACKSSKKKSKSTRDKSKMPTNQAKKSKSTTPIACNQAKKRLSPQPRLPKTSLKDLHSEHLPPFFTPCGNLRQSPPF